VTTATITDSAKLQARHRRYNASAKGRARHRRYNTSEKGAARYARYEDAHVVVLHDGVTGYKKRVPKTVIEERAAEAGVTSDVWLAAYFAHVSNLRDDIRAKQTKEREAFRDAMAVDSAAQVEVRPAEDQPGTETDA
jgi:hypothetical protein